MVAYTTPKISRAPAFRHLQSCKGIIDKGAGLTFRTQLLNGSMILGAPTSREAIAREIHRRKRDNPLYSMNSFAKRSGISLAYLSLILSGKRRMSPRVAARFAATSGLSQHEREYFLLLAKRETAPDDETRSFLDKKLRELLRRGGGRREDLLAFDVISDWHYSAILEAIQVEELPHTAAAIGERLGLPEARVKEALGKLRKLKLLRRTGKRWERCDGGFLNTSTEVKSLALRSFHKQALRLAILALEHDPLEKRSCTGITMAIDPDRLPEAKRRIQEFQQELMEFLEGGARREVYQLETALFRLQNREQGEE